MCKRFDKNRENFVKMVHELGNFNEQEISEAFQQKYPGEIVAENATMQEILELLENIGTLKYNGLNYYVVPPEQRISFIRPFLAMAL